MSDLWKYDPVMCDGDFCPRDCDKCGKEPKGRSNSMTPEELLRALHDNATIYAESDHFYEEAEKTVQRMIENGYENDNRIDELEKTLRDCRNELCLRCGRYVEKHNGACDGCRWKDMEKIKE